MGVWQTRRIETVLMKWDGVPGNLGHIIPTEVNSDLWASDTNKIKDLQRLNGDSELAAALLIAYWFRNNSDICHWLKRELADIVLEFYSYGVGSQFDLAKFGTTAELVFQHLLVSGFMLVSHLSS